VKPGASAAAGSGSAELVVRPGTAAMRTGTAVEPRNSAAGSGSAEPGALPGTVAARNGTAVRPGISAAAGSGSAELLAPPDTAAMRIGTAVKAGTLVAPDFGSADLEVTCFDILALRCVPQSAPPSGLRTTVLRSLAPLLAGTNPGSPSNLPRTLRLHGSSGMECPCGGPDRGPRLFYLENRPRSVDGIHSDGRSSY
jgi:hypothetical protein